MNRFALQARAGQDKRDHPDRYCPVAKCLWRTNGTGRCPRHAVREAATTVKDASVANCQGVNTHA